MLMNFKPLARALRLRLTVTDRLGISDATPDTRVVRVNQAPDGTITTPSAATTTIAAGQSVSFAGTGNDPDGDTPLSFAWSFTNFWSAETVPHSFSVWPSSTVFVVGANSTLPPSTSFASMPRKAGSSRPDSSTSAEKTHASTSSLNSAPTSHVRRG